MRDAITYRPEIDGLRAVAVTAILLDHAGIAWLPGGYLGVDLFFVISGYVITRLLVADLDKGRLDLWAFWRRRARRILPPLVVLLAICLPIAWVLMLPREWDLFLPVFYGALAMVPNIMLWLDVGYFNTAAETKPLLHLWSLGVEEQFYLLYPFLLIGLWRWRPRGLRWGLLALALISLILAMALVLLAPRAGFYLLPSRVWELLAGALAALSLWRPGPRAAQIWALVGVVMIAASFVVVGPRNPGLATMPLLLGAVLCVIAGRSETWVARGLSFGPVVAVGRISFGTYLWHWPLLVFPRVAFAEELSLTLKLGLVALALGFGWASWRFVEQPFRRSDAPLLPTWGLGAGLATLGGVAAVAGALHWADAQGMRYQSWPGLQPEAIEAMTIESNTALDRNLCHLGDETVPLAPFRATWACDGSPVNGLPPWPVAVFGDSHAADFGMVLRLTGRNPMLISGHFCSMVPSRMRADCRLLAEDLRSAATVKGISTIILVNNWQEKELTPQDLVELELWWGEVFSSVVLVSPLPRFEMLDDRLVRWSHDRVAAQTADRSVIDAFDAARARVAGSELLVIDAAGLFCGARPGCSPMGEGPLMLDTLSHLTPEGARLYAKALEASGMLGDLP